MLEQWLEEKVELEELGIKLESRMPPGDGGLLRRLLEESVQRLNEEGIWRREAEKGEHANGLTRKRPGILDDLEKNPQFNAEKSNNKGEPEVEDIADEEEPEVVDIADEDEDFVTEGDSDSEEDESNEEDEDIFIIVSKGNEGNIMQKKSSIPGPSEEEGSTDSLIKGVVLNYLRDVVPSLAREFEDTFTAHETRIQWEEVIAAFTMNKENLLKADVKEKISYGDKSDCATDNLVKGLVFNFLKEIAPGLVEDFEETFSSCHTQLQLKDVLQQFRRHTRPSLPSAGTRTAKGSKPGVKKNRSTGCRVRKFTQDEDGVIREVMAKVDQVGSADIRALATRLDRGYRSIQARIESLQINSGIYKRKTFSFTEDCTILETLILPRLKKEKLTEILLSNCHFEKLAVEFHRKLHSVRHRWEGKLQPTLLQYYAGTLNMQVGKMLANFIADTYQNFSEIDWPEVAARPDFAGHTEQSLKNMYFQELLSSTRKKLGNQEGQGDDDVTLRQVAEHTQDKQPGRRMVKEKWQQALIAFFEMKVDQLAIKSFL